MLRSQLNVSPIIVLSIEAYAASDSLPFLESKEPLYMFNPIGSKATVCAFTNKRNIIITGHESGKVSLFDVETGEEIDSKERAHNDVVTDLQMSKDRTYCITSSKDKSARVRRYLAAAGHLANRTMLDIRYRGAQANQDLYHRNPIEQRCVSTNTSLCKHCITLYANVLG